MTYADRWLLPDGIEEFLPAGAVQVEGLRRRLVDTYRSWGYDIVIPPLLEFTDSLLIGLGREIDLMTFKVTDQISGRSMGIRADITPQIARMDAHSFKRKGVSRFCYGGHVLHTRPKTPLATRAPIQAGVELYGEAGASADIEVISLLLQSLQTVGLPSLHIDLGHVGIYRALATDIDFTTAQEEAFFDLLQRKAATEIAEWVSANVRDQELAQLLIDLPNMAGNAEILSGAEQRLTTISPAAGAAVAELASIASVIQQRYPEARLHFDLSELRGYHYHTGIVFAAYAPGFGSTIANGGRYDSIGEVFGRSRPATGFAIDVTALHRLGLGQDSVAQGIYAPASDDPTLWQTTQALRAKGERVVNGLANETPNFEDIQCDRQLVLEGDQYVIKTV